MSLSPTMLLKKFLIFRSSLLVDFVQYVDLLEKMIVQLLANCPMKWGAL